MLWRRTDDSCVWRLVEGAWDHGMFLRNVDAMLRFSAHSSSFSSRAEIRNYPTFQADESKALMREILEDPTVMSCLLNSTLSPIPPS